MMTSVEATQAPAPAPGIEPGTLRAALEAQRAGGTPYTLKAAVGWVVPLAVELAEFHEAGGAAYVHPSALSVTSGGAHLDSSKAASPPTLAADQSYLAPEVRGASPGGARASVYAIGALLYELVTLRTVGPTMPRPTEVVPTLPAELELILGKALVADPAHRPDDLRALAQAIHHLAPTGSIAPPPADESHLDHDGAMDVDVSLSMLPPAPSFATSPYEVAVREAEQPQGGPDSHDELSALKARLEADRRPRWVVVKEGMDHGPFSAVELLQQIATHSFVEADLLKDNVSREERPIKDWEDFAVFAQHARRHRDIQAEKVAIEQVVVSEKKSTRSKAIIGAAVVSVLVAVMAVWLFTQQGAKDDTVAVHGENVTNIETQGGIHIDPKKARPGAGKGVVSTTADGTPILSGGGSCESAVAAYNEVISLGQKGQADITRGQYAAVLNNGSYVAACGAPSSMAVNVCAAVQNGRAVGVTVTTNPSNPGIASCIAGRVRAMSFPSNPKLDVARTTFAAE
ncbi:MAG: hypothetical protein KIT72_11795 [Polyangiaceae bacterium]|nr:hypothetical protein [Polyangiaceae bacterium]MCW5791096.1 hypothetical protein [Polyangiaceae bacterium]